MSENKKNTLGTELDDGELDKVAGGIYADYVGRCKYCGAKTEGEWNEELRKMVCRSCKRPLGSVGLMPQVQEVI